MSNEGKWTFSRSEEHYNEMEYFESKAQAIEEGKEYFEGDKFYVGQVKECGLGVLVDVSSILEHINVNMVDEVGEHAEDYLAYTETEHDKELEQEIQDVITKWIERHEYQPTFFKVVNIEAVEVE